MKFHIGVSIVVFALFIGGCSNKVTVQIPPASPTLSQVIIPTEVELSGMNLEVISKDYNEVSNGKVLNGKFTFVGKKNDDFFVIYGDRQFGPYKSVGAATSLDGKIAFVATMNNEEQILVHGAESYGPYKASEKYPTYIYDFALVGGKMAVEIGFRINNQSWGSRILYDGKEFGAEYQRVYTPMEIGGALMYSAVTKDNKYYRVFPIENRVEESDKTILTKSGKRFGPYTELLQINYFYRDPMHAAAGIKNDQLYVIDLEREKEFGPFSKTNNAPEFTYLDGQLTFVTYTPEGAVAYVGDRKYGPFSRIEGSPFLSNGKISLIVKKEEASFLVSGDSSYGPYDDIYEGTSSNDYYGSKLGRSNDYFIAQKDGKDILIYPGQPILRASDFNHDVISNPVLINGNLAVTAGNFYKGSGGKTSDLQDVTVVYDGADQGNFDYVEAPVSIGDKLAFVAYGSDNSTKTLYYDGKKYGTYMKLNSLQEVGGKLAFVFNKDNKWFVHYGDKDVGPFDDIGFFSKGLDHVSSCDSAACGDNPLHLGELQKVSEGRSYTFQTIDNRLILTVKKEGLWGVYLL